VKCLDMQKKLFEGLKKAAIVKTLKKEKDNRIAKTMNNSFPKVRGGVKERQVGVEAEEENHGLYY